MRVQQQTSRGNLWTKGCDDLTDPVTVPIQLYRTESPEEHSCTPVSDGMPASGDHKLNQQATVRSQPKNATTYRTGHCRNTTFPRISTTAESAS